MALVLFVCRSAELRVITSRGKLARFPNCSERTMRQELLTTTIKLLPQRNLHTQEFGFNRHVPFSVAGHPKDVLILINGAVEFIKQLKMMNFLLRSSVIFLQSDFAL